MRARRELDHGLGLNARTALSPAHGAGVGHDFAGTATLGADHAGLTHAEHAQIDGNGAGASAGGTGAVMLGCHGARAVAIVAGLIARILDGHLCTVLCLSRESLTSTITSHR